MSREIDLIGGFYRDEPWSAQDTVNWLPVPDESGAARSPIKLRGLPGLKPFGGTVVEALEINGSAPTGRVGEAYSFSYTAMGGVGPYTFTLVSGSMPPGLSFSNGAISGTPTTIGGFSFRVRVVDSTGQIAEKDDSISVVAASGLWILFGRPQDAGTNDAYSIASATPSSWGGAKRLINITGQPNDPATINLSGAGGGNLYATEAGGPIVIRSANLGASWTVTALDAVTRQQRIDVRNGRVIASTPHDFQYSDDAGVTRVVSLNAPMRQRHFYGASSIVGGAVDLISSTDNGTTRNLIAGFPTFGRSIQLLIPGGTHLVAIGGPAGAANQFSRVPIETPTIGHTPFTVAAVPATDTWNAIVAPCVAYGNGIFVAVTDQGRIVRSTDEGATWTVSSFTFTGPQSIVFGDGVFLICGLAGAIRTSVDGDTWTLVPSGTFGTDNITNAIYIA